MSASLIRRIVVIVASIIAAVAVTISGIGDINDPVDKPAATAPPDMPQQIYVALGSSYASGPDGARGPFDVCMRSSGNYPNGVATAMHLRLIDATCSGSTIENIISYPQRFTHKLQIDAVVHDASLVTITTGGNDISYVGRLLAMSCANVLNKTVPMLVHPLHGCGVGRHVSAEPKPAAYAKVRRGLVETVRQVHLRAPNARIVIVDYLPVTVAGEPPCARLPLTDAELAETVRVFDALAAATAEAAAESGAQLVRASVSGKSHTVCSADPWLRGFGPPIPYHPNSKGKSGVAQVIVDALGGTPG